MAKRKIEFKQNCEYGEPEEATKIVAKHMKAMAAELTDIDVAPFALVAYDLPESDHQFEHHMYLAEAGRTPAILGYLAEAEREVRQNDPVGADIYDERFK